MSLTLELAEPFNVCELDRVGYHMPPYRGLSLLLCDFTIEQAVESLHAPLSVPKL